VGNRFAATFGAVSIAVFATHASAQGVDELPEGLPRVERVVEPDNIAWLPLTRHWSERQCRRGNVDAAVATRLWRHGPDR